MEECSSKSLLPLNSIRRAATCLCTHLVRVPSSWQICVREQFCVTLTPNYSQEWMDPAQHSFFTEITSSISDVRFSYDGRYIVSRDYMTVKIWDVNMERDLLRQLVFMNTLETSCAIHTRTMPFLTSLRLSFLIHEVRYDWIVQ